MPYPPNPPWYSTPNPFLVSVPALDYIADLDFFDGLSCAIGHLDWRTGYEAAAIF